MGDIEHLNDFRASSDRDKLGILRIETMGRIDTIRGYAEIIKKNLGNLPKNDEIEQITEWINIILAEGNNLHQIVKILTARDE